VINEVELRDEVVVVLVAGIDVGLRSHAADAVKVMDVNVHKHPEEAAQDLLAHLLEVLGERYTWCVERRNVFQTLIYFHLRNFLIKSEIKLFYNFL